MRVTSGVTRFLTILAICLPAWAFTADTESVRASSTLNIASRIAAADSLISEGCIQEAISLFNVALAIASESRTPSDTALARLHWKFGTTLMRTKNLDEAENQLERASQIYLAQPQPDRGRLLDIQRDIGLMYFYRSDRDNSMETFKQVLVAAESLYMPDSTGLVRHLNNLANMCSEIGNDREAGRYYERGLNILKIAFGADGDRSSDMLTRIGHQFRIMHEFGEAEIYLREALDSAIASSGERSQEALELHRELSYVTMSLGLSSQCIDHRRKAIDISTALFGRSSQKAGANYMDLGVYYRHLCRYAEAETSFTTALEILENADCLSLTTIASCRKELAKGYVSQARYGEASRQLHLAEDDLKEAGDTLSNLMAEVLNALGNCRKALGDFRQARDYYHQALRIRIRIAGEWGQGVGEVSVNLGSLHASLHEYDSAICYYARATKVREVIYGPGHRFLIYSLTGMADVCVELGMFDAADSSLRRAREICDASYEREHLHSAQIQRLYGRLAQARGNYEAAEKHFRQSLRVYQKILGEDNWLVIPVLEDMSLLYGCMHKFDDARRCLAQLLNARQEYVQLTFPVFTEEEKTTFIIEYPLIVPTLLSLACVDSSSATAELAFDMCLRGKAAVMDAVAAEQRTGFCSSDKSVQETLDRYRETVRELSSLTFSQFASTQRMRALTHTCDSLLLILNRCGEFRAEKALGEAGKDEVTAALDSNSVLWEIVCFTPYDFDVIGTRSQHEQPTHYLAFGLDSRGEMLMTDLGRAGVIDSLITRTRKTLYEHGGRPLRQRTTDMQCSLDSITGRIHELLFSPMQSTLEGKDVLLVSPDGLLNLLPLGILPERNGTCAAERYAVGYLSSGRDLVKHQRDRDFGHTALIVVNPDYNCTDPQIVGDRFFDLEQSEDDSHSFPACLPTILPVLPQTVPEGDLISALLSVVPEMSVHLLSGAAANERAVQNIMQESFLVHICSHGFVCESNQGTYVERLRASLRLTGMALAGANATIQRGEGTQLGEYDGLLTALELGSLNLRDAELVVLSGCETSMGQVLNGEGVFGLRRAVSCAGAHSMISSMWPIAPYQSREIMTRFYRSWLSGSTKAKALQDAMLGFKDSLYEERGIAHPVDWGALVLIGDPH